MTTHYIFLPHRKVLLAAHLQRECLHQASGHAGIEHHKLFWAFAATWLLRHTQRGSLQTFQCAITTWLGGGLHERHSCPAARRRSLHCGSYL